MKIHLHLALLMLSVGTSFAEEAVLQRNTVMRVDRSLTSLKAGTVVEIVERGDKAITIRYKGQTGTIPLSGLAANNPPAVTPAAAAKTAPAANNAPKSLVVENPQSSYGNLVKKAETNAAKHDDNLVKPANQVTDDNPSN